MTGKYILNNTRQPFFILENFWMPVNRANINMCVFVLDLFKKIKFSF